MLQLNECAKRSMYIMFFQLWDVGVQKRLRNMTGHVARVGALSWNQYILSR